MTSSDILVFRYSHHSWLKSTRLFWTALLRVLLVLVVLPEAQQVRAQPVLLQVWVQAREREWVQALESEQEQAMAPVSELVSAQEPEPEQPAAVSPVSAAPAWAALAKAGPAAAWVQSAVSAARPPVAIPAQPSSAATR